HRLLVQLRGRLMAGEGFDLAAYRASQAEASFETFHVHLGETKDDDGEVAEEAIEIPPARRWPLSVQKLFGEGNIEEAIRKLAGDEAAVLFDRYDWTVGEFVALSDALAKWQGFQTGQPSVPQPGRGLTPKSS
ncbi:MAG: hypothetical protein J2P57_23550, partial [Acidimicrobiaceae bacterium]|nr:hypothetical protein [Acidimicrobiaceae bacterium]